jgi:GlcNAc-PI de-N-acetylase
MNIILSPHLDDAVFNVWHVISKDKAKVITIFAGVPSNEKSTIWDRLGGARDSREMMTARRTENKTALAGQNVEIIDLDFLDNQYGQRTLGVEAIKNELRKYISKQDTLFVPLAASRIFKHPDHVIVRTVGQELLAEGFRLIFYPDIPYMRIPSTVSSNFLSNLQKKVKTLTGFNSTATVIVLDDIAGEKKQKAMKAYETQYRITNLTSFGSLGRKANLKHEIEIELNK